MTLAHPFRPGFVAALCAAVLIFAPLAAGASDSRAQTGREGAAEDGAGDAIAPGRARPPAAPDPAETAETAAIAARPIPAEQAALLAKLAQADPDSAKGLDRQLRALWDKSGSPAMDLLLDRGRAALEDHDLRAAIQHLTALTDHAPDFAEGWHARASAFYEAQLLGPAVADLERALALNPVHYDAIFGLGTILEIIGDETRAYAAYQRVLDLHPHHEEATKAAERLRPGIEGQDI